MGVFIYLVSLLVVIISALYLSFKKTYRLWSKLNVAHLEPTFPFGNFGAILKSQHFGYIIADLYKKLKNHDDDYAGVYMFKSPALLVTGPEFAKMILVRDFNTFTDRGVYHNKKDDPLSANVFFLEGEEWHTLRKKMTPAFSSGKMKMMFHTVIEVAEQLREYIESNNVIDNDVDVKDLLGRFTTDVISSCVFGLDGKSIADPESEFRRVGNRVMKMSKLKSVLVVLAVSFRELARQLGFRYFDRKSTEFFNQMVHQTIAFRRQENVHRNDIMQIMMEMMRQDYESTEGLTIDEVAANAFIFFFAGFESSSTTMVFALHNLALAQDIQDAARKEIENVLKQHDGKLSYESISEMSLLHRIVNETLRKDPPISSIHRVANENYILPNGKEIPIGTKVIIPVLAIHRDKDIYPNPEKFDPDRFTAENETKRHPYTFLPFGEGPRNCLGLRFAYLQIKVGLIMILRNYIVETTEQTELPAISIDPNSITYIPKNSVWLKFRKV